jgi:hypothetical protein
MLQEINDKKFKEFIEIHQLNIFGLMELKKHHFETSLNYFKKLLEYDHTTFVLKKNLNSIAVCLLHIKYFKKKININDLKDIDNFTDILLSNINQNNILTYIGLGMVLKYKGINFIIKKINN